jgi:flagellin
MSLGVLNNINAIYAENNLNNTSNSLSTVLNQLSSGSKINSGADDAAGLSLVDGLQANSMALSQSQTNSTEGVGLLTVADGALSQVTNLLNRAVTLATEASNGTLNSSQDTAANQEYQSILSEISNIGSTTTYNDTSVFGKSVNIYTGDSSTTGASVDDLNIASLSSSNVGDSGGVMAYSNGSNNVFVNLSGANGNAKSTDTLNSSGATSIDVSYLVKGANGSTNAASTTISVGTNTNYANTAAGMISAINNSGLGLNATFTTQSIAGVQGGGAQTGIEISGGQISAGTAASSASTSGILNPTGIPSSELLTTGQSFTFSQGGTSVGSVTVGSTNNTLQTLATAIGTATGGAVTATVITNGDGTQSLALGNSSPSQGALAVATTAGSGSSAPTFTSTNAAGTNSPLMASSITAAVVTGVASQTAVAGSNTFTLAGGGATSTLTGVANSAVQLTAGTSITITNNLPGSNTPTTYVVGAGTNSFTLSGNTVYTGSGQNSMANLVSIINSTSTAHSLGTTASAVNGVLTVASTTSQTGDNITLSNATLTNATNQLAMYSPTDGGAATTGTLTKTEIYAGAGASQDDVVSGTMVLSNGTSADNVTLTGNGTSTTYADMISTINANSATLGVTASWSTTMGSSNNQAGILLTSNTPSGAATITTSGSTLGDVTTATGGSKTVTALNAGASSAEDDVISGSVTVHNGSSSVAFTATGTSTYADLATAINGANIGVTATWDSTNNALDLTSATKGANAAVTLTGVGLTDTIAGGGTAISINSGLSSVGTAPTNTAALVDVNGSGSSAVGTAGAAATYATGILQLGQTPTNGAPTTITDGTDQITGAVTLQAGTSGTALTFVQGSGQNTANTIYTGGTDVTHLVAAINANSTTLGLTASDPGTGSGAIYLQATTAGSLTGGITATSSTLADTTYSSATLGSTGGVSGTGSNALTGVTGTDASITVGLSATGGAINTSDVLTTGAQIQLTNGGVTDTFIVGANTTGSPAPTHTFYTGANNNTVANLAATITASADNGISASANTNGLVVSSTAAETGNITLTSSTLADTTQGAYGNVSLGTFGSVNDTVSGSFHLTDAGGAQTITATQGETVSQLLTTINGASNTNPDGVHATWQASGNSGSGSIVLTSTTEGTAGSISALSTSLTDTAPSVNLTYTASNAYSTGISGDATNKVFDSTAGQSSTAVAGMVANQKSASGVATISYSDGAGQSLSATDLSNQSDAETSLTALNNSITAVAAQDGYIGAQINTLNAVSQVLSTQQENVTSAQNAVQATDYASATSNMSKYEILSQTGISALAQANSMQQEVTKLLQ